MDFPFKRSLRFLWVLILAAFGVMSLMAILFFFVDPPPMDFIRALPLRSGLPPRRGLLGHTVCCRFVSAVFFGNIYDLYQSMTFHMPIVTSPGKNFVTENPNAISDY